MTGTACRRLATVAPQLGWRPRMDPSGLAEDDMLGRLALWLADVSVEAALAQNSGQVGGTLERSTDPDSPGVGPAR